MRFAIVASFNWAFRYGLNAILNALDYHEHTLVDVHYMYDHDVPLEYIARAAEAFDFSVQGYSITEYREKYPPLDAEPLRPRWRWGLIFYNYKLAIELADSYDAVMIMDVDHMITSNLESYFRAVVGTDLIMLPHFAGAEQAHINGSNAAQWADKVGVDHRFAVNLNSPVIFDPKRNIDFLERVWTFGKITHSPFRGVFWTLVEQDRLNDVIVLPNLIWVNPRFLLLPYVYEKANGKRTFFIFGDKVMMVHRKWWRRGEMLREVDTYSGPNFRDQAIQNVDNFTEECKLLNTTGKLKLNWVLDTGS